MSCRPTSETQGVTWRLRDPSVGGESFCSRENPEDCPSFTFVGRLAGLVLGDVGGGPSSWLWSGRLPGPTRGLSGGGLSLV